MPLPTRIIPAPASVHVVDGCFVVSEQTCIVAPEELAERAAQLRKALGVPTGLSLPLRTPEQKPQKDCIQLSLSDQAGDSEEGYELEVSSDRVRIRASSSAGVFYGIQSLLQLLPPEVVSRSKAEGVSWSVPCVKIQDAPRFKWRAFMLDEGRYFQGKEVVKSLLDQMAALKMNVFHWHLVEHQGWRIEIKKYPRLTEVGSKRKCSQIDWAGKEFSYEPHEGFYTQEEIREIVCYAAERNITIVPEIEMPGHAASAIAAYPWLGTKTEPIEVPGRFSKTYDTFNPASEKVYQTLSEILDEVIDLFPSKVIHIGGDEVRFDQWQESDEVKALMEREGLKTFADVQLYFTNRMSRVVEKKGRRAMGWNDILGQDIHGLIGEQTADASKLAPEAIIQFWKGDLEQAREAVEAGHDVVNSIHGQTYLDYPYNATPLRKSYHFEPIFEGLPPELHHRVLGLGCQMWGEWIPTSEKLERQTFPRFAAYAEVGWTPVSERDYDKFSEAMERQYRRWDIQGIRYNSPNE